MKKLLAIAVLLVLCSAPLIRAQELENAGVDYTQALEKKGLERIKAFEDYVKKYPDANANTFTKWAYYWLAVENYNSKRYNEAVSYGLKALSLGVPDKQSEATANLVLANAFGVKEGPVYDQAKAGKYADKALALAKEGNFTDILKQAQALKNALGGASAPPKVQTPTDKINALYAARNYQGAISYYNSLDDSDKKNLTILKIYADSLFQANKYDAALEKFNEAYAKEKKGMTAERIADIYLAKSKRDAKLLDTAIEWYVEAGLLFGKEKNGGRQDTALKTAKYQLGEKYSYNERAKKYQASLKNIKPAASSNDKEIARLQKEYSKLERDLSAKYQDIEMPSYEQEKLDKLTAQIEKLKAGSANTGNEKIDQEGEALVKDKEKIENEFNALVDKIKKRLGI